LENEQAEDEPPFQHLRLILGWL